MKSPLRLPGPFLVRLAFWALLLLVFPLSGPMAAYSFRAEVLGHVVFAAPADGAAPQENSVEFTDRCLARLVEAEEREPDAWLRDDYRIARVTLGFARRGSPLSHVEATYAVLGVHPDQVWPRIVARRHAMLGAADYEAFYGEAVYGGGSSPKKPVQSVRAVKRGDSGAVA